ncbi:DUF4404 family protein [Marinibactrum halimedae]|uniref:DUF4404 family protein n=1 Tax=Marinibactrum halimedae TaxID=1444977 RepID=A0AA37T939_9GAMM|nr:DUF4404 family protein [Marinibactrum halimedae]MCD9461263.1 DUF4404 family protein [Marinibactrum halimedae]GLS26201.1 hypothetical protein GCM10007877_19160 [Marinibactrum halimedae]
MVNTTGPHTTVSQSDPSQSLPEAIVILKTHLNEALDTSEKDLIGDVLMHMTSNKPLTKNSGLRARIENQLGVFETSHPRLAKSLREVLDALHRMGI